MNHLAGLEVAGSFDLSELIKDADRDAFEGFKRDYYALAEPAQRVGTPQYMVSSASLPASGWRPLDDVTLWRFLAADRRDGKFQPGKSMARLKAALLWRRELRVDDMMARPPPGLDYYRTLRIRPFVGHDKSGRPVQFERIGEFLVSPNWKRYSLDEWIRLYAWDMDNVIAELRRSSLRAGRPITKCVYVGDMRGISIWQAKDLLTNKGPFLGKLARAVESHSPEMVGTIIVFNLPRVAQRIFKAVSLLLDPVVMSKIEVYSGVPYERFKELMDPEMIPLEYGGLNDIHYPATLIPESGHTCADVPEAQATPQEPGCVKPEPKSDGPGVGIAVLFGRAWPITTGLAFALIGEAGNRFSDEFVIRDIFTGLFLFGLVMYYLIGCRGRLAPEAVDFADVVGGDDARVSDEALGKGALHAPPSLKTIEDEGCANDSWFGTCCCLLR
mmetsp:Transcript_84141/g.242944  ORF Transcript_84141/g.242944 Transcript_84141/m.242944 type:complete len:443 (+) Transcript_84141:93-1421(+)